MPIEVMYDAAGMALCSHAAWGRTCRWRDECTFSHDVPPLLAARLAERRRGQHLRASALHNATPGPREEDTRVPPWLARLKSRAVIIRFDPTAYPLREAAEAFLCRGASSALPLEQLHNTPLRDDAPPPASPTLLDALSTLHGRASLPEPWRAASAENCHTKHGRERALRATPEYQHFLTVYSAFVRDVLAPACADPDGRAAADDDDNVCEEPDDDAAAGGGVGRPARPSGGSGGATVFAQRPPTLRVHLAGQRAASGRIGQHRDRDYAGHVASEVNSWGVNLMGSMRLFTKQTAQL